MSGTITGALLVALSAALATPGAAVAQQCSPEEKRQLARRQEHAIIEMRESGSARDYVALIAAGPSLSPACRREQARLVPASIRCTPEERSIVLQRYEEALAAVEGSDVAGVLAALEELEASVSPQCWIASNYHQDPRVQAACSDEERRVIAESASPMLDAMRKGLEGDVSALRASREIFGALGPECQAALSAASRQPGEDDRPTPAERAAFHGIGAVLGLGDGLHVAPGIGACDPSGCVGF